MKLNLLLFGAIVASSAICAQPIITNANFFQPGTQVIAFDANSEGISDGADGPNVSWDFTNLQSVEISNIWGGEVLIPNQVTGTNFFLSASIANQLPNGTVRFWNNTDSQLSTLGHESDNEMLILSDEAVLMNYPFTYGSVNSDIAYGDLSSACSNYTWECSGETEGVGYGTLHLPTGTYENVLKVRRVTFSVRKHNEYDLERENNIVEHFWFSPSIEGPLLYMRQWANNGCPGTNEGAEVTFISPSFSTDNSEIQTVELSFEVFPNPARDQAVLRVNSEKQTEIQLSITDLVGHNVNFTTQKRKIYGSQIIDLDISTLNSGVYLVIIQSEEISYTQKLVVN